MKGIWRGEDDEVCLRYGKVYEIVGEEKGEPFVGLWYSVTDETGEDFLYPAEDFELIEEKNEKTEEKNVIRQRKVRRC